MKPTEQIESTLDHVNMYSTPSDLKITDIRFTDIYGAPMHCSLMKIYTNSELVGFGEVRDAASKTYALMVKDRILGENPCNIDKIFRRIKQFGWHGRQSGGVCGIEVALWDIAGKAYGIPVYQMLGGKFRDKIRMYCDTDIDPHLSGVEAGQRVKQRLEKGYTLVKFDLGIGLLADVEGALCAPLGFLDQMKAYPPEVLFHSRATDEASRALRNKVYDLHNIAHPFTGIRITEKGLDYLEQYAAEVRSAVGYHVPLAIDHIGHIGVEDCIKLAQRLDKYTFAWLEDLVPWQYTDQYVHISRACQTPICTGEDIYLKENFLPLLQSRGVSVIHPDILTCGGILECKKIGDLAQDYEVAMAIHMAESPIACMAAVHTAAATENFLALEFHSEDVPWWSDLVCGLPHPIVQQGYIAVPDTPGLGIKALNDDVIAEHIHPGIPGQWEATEAWNNEWSHDRLWS
ncbi:hypothetical protein U27_04962 [Candidatus Vecturithrix granuli]|uniref:Mandelate racemase/muconate lactonizing enzyme C-terminal domain-containing protein n=1 Tax=Vecturithrix granuli TaxID=1499967 RepID=A0A081C084_VECG1|nr:hypothetical protein U27_04962 [Candidatus Vecturithrix granuli]